MGTEFQHGYQHYCVYAFSQNYQHGHVENWHQHDRIQLIHTLSGVIRVQTHAGTWICPPGRGLWIPAQQPHALIIHGNVKVRGVLLEDLGHENFDKHCRVVNITPLLRELMNAALSIMSKIEVNTRNARLLALILDELNWLETLPLQLPEAQSPTLIQLCQTVRQSLAYDWNLGEAAKLLHMSTKTFSRQFQKETLMSFAQWLRQAKLMHAMLELCMQRPITQIALDLGYESPSAFSAMFKRETAMTPSEYVLQFKYNEL